MVEGCQNFPGSCKRYLADSVFGTVLLTIKQILVYGCKFVGKGYKRKPLTLILVLQEQ